MAAVVLAVSDARRLRLVAGSVVGALLLIAIPTVVQRVTGTYDFQWWGFAKVDRSVIDGEVARAVGRDSRIRNGFAQWLIVLIPVAASVAVTTPARVRRERLIACGVWMVFAVAVAAVFCTRSRMGAAALGVVALVLAARRSLVLVGGALVAVLVAIMITGGGLRQIERYGEVGALFGADADGKSSAAGYASTFRAGLEMFADEPLTGVGSDNFILEYPAIVEELGIDTSGRAISPHNGAVQVLAETGVVGAAAFVGAVWCVLRRRRQARDELVRLDDAFGARLMRALGYSFLGYGVSTMTLNIGNPQMILLVSALAIVAACRTDPVILAAHATGRRRRDGRLGERPTV